MNAVHVEMVNCCNREITDSQFRLKTLASVIEGKPKDPKPLWPHQSAFSGQIMCNQWCVRAFEHDVRKYAIMH